MTHPSLRRSLAVAAVLVATLSSCFTGERPRFEDDEQTFVSTGSEAVDTVLLRLESVDGSRFTASYQIDTRFGTLRSTAEVTQTSSRQRSITVQNEAVHIRFTDDGDDERTCDVISEECETGLNDARISNTQLSHRFYAPSFAQRLRVSADRRIGDPVPSSTSVAGQPAVCVDVPVTGGTETYCALESGALARFIGADVEIELTSYSPEPDDALFDDA